ncbi:hypothetical protein IIB79_08165 [candidate division KSB1 bacterium]|nr:hypothetical protein [candidate division KSB1 bacterium]
MSNELTYWWSKYMILRALKREYEKEAKNCQYPQILKDEYFDRILDAIK